MGRTLAVVCVSVSFAAPALAQLPPFDNLAVGVDDQGFITLAEGEDPPERFFPLGTFFYPSPYPEMDSSSVVEDYQNFAAMGGNFVVAPWVPADWPTRPGVAFGGPGVTWEHVGAAHDAGVKILADPTLFWGDTGVWNDDGALVSSGDRQTWFDNMVDDVVDAGGGDIFMGYYDWDQPAWRYFDSRNRLPEPRPSFSYLNNATSELKVLENGEGASHAIFMAQGDAVKVRDLWVDYHNGADIVGGVVLPYPDPITLQTVNEQYVPKIGCLLPNYYASVSGSLADAIHQTSGYPVPEMPRSKPYIAVLQGKDQGGVPITDEEIRFQAYDAIIHGAKGLAWYDDNDFLPLNSGFFYDQTFENIFPTLTELGIGEINGVIKGDYDDLVVAVTTEVGPPFPNVVEESTFICGKLVPKTHFLSDRIIMDGVAKEFNDKTYLIVACRPHEGAAAEYKVMFRPFFSAHDYYHPWGAKAEFSTVYKMWSGWLKVTQGAGGGWWEDTFHPGDVFIYKFQKPEPWQPPPE